MKTSSSKRTCFLFYTICFSVFVNAQQKIPMNYVGVSGIAGLNRLSLATGVEYERWYFAKDQFGLGAKAQYVFPSKTINYIFSSNDGIQRGSQFQLMATSYFFTNAENEYKGFFLSFSAGVNFLKWEAEAYDGSGNTYLQSFNETSPGFELSIGAQTRIGKTTAIRFTSGYQGFPARKYKDYVSGTGISQLYIKASLGF
jgi:hypothetical protein